VRYGEIRATLERAGTLISNNVSEFERVPGLKLENRVQGRGSPDQDVA
jgi:predicted nucleic acid-binding protein